MTPNEQKAFDAMREALESVEWHGGGSCWIVDDDKIEAALTAANAVHCGYDETTGNCTHNHCCRADHTDALLFAEILERPGYGWHSTPEKVAAELRRQHKEIKALKDALFQMQNAAKAIAKKLTAANAVSHAKTETAPATEGGAITSEYSANAVQPQAQGEARLPVYFAQYEYAPDFSVVVSVYRRRADDVPELIHSEALPKQIDDHPQATEPAGYKLVPVEPTPEMLYAIQNDCDILPPRGKRIWAAMLAAAPEAKQ